MSHERLFPITLCIPKHCRDKLREIAARQNLENPDQVTSAATIGREILVNHVKQVLDTELLMMVEAESRGNRRNQN
jgi:hypothetical protein